MKPVKRRGNRRYYQHHEVLLIRRIRDLLYEQGFTINGARHRLESDVTAPAAAAADADWPVAREGDPRSLELRRPHATRLDGRKWAESWSKFGRSWRKYGGCWATTADPAIIGRSRRGVAQPGSAPAWGAGGRKFESSRPDHNIRAGSVIPSRPFVFCGDRVGAAPTADAGWIVPPTGGDQASGASRSARAYDRANGITIASSWCPEPCPASRIPRKGTICPPCRLVPPPAPA